MKQLRHLWQCLRAFTREDAYERYCRHHELNHPEAARLDRSAFYLAEQERKWNGINRCC